jgi:hypothetical protein
MQRLVDATIAADKLADELEARSSTASRSV